jgi:hypothetical protein
MVAKDDWRLRGQGKYLSGVTFGWSKYGRANHNSDHDHCSFCWSKFMEAQDFLKEGYVSDDGLFWICVTCFGDFKESFGLKIKAGSV